MISPPSSLRSLLIPLAAFDAAFAFDEGVYVAGSDGTLYKVDVDLTTIDDNCWADSGEDAPACAATATLSAAAPAPSWTAPIERFLASAAASLSAATQAPPPPVKPRTRTVDFTSAPSHYTTLGVAPTASQSEIRAAYRRLALEHHPDRRGARGEERMARVNAAYAVLDSPRARRSYDYDLRFGRFDGARRRTTEAD